MSKKIQEAAQQIGAVAQRLATRNHEAAPELLRIAEYLEGMPEMSMGSMEAMGPMDAMPFTHPLHPGINSFVQMKAQKSSEDGYDTHVCSVTFKAPQNVDQGDIMKAILKICDELGVEAHGFKWSKSEERRNKN